MFLTINVNPRAIEVVNTILGAAISELENKESSRVVMGVTLKQVAQAEKFRLKLLDVYFKEGDKIRAKIKE